MIGSMIKSVEVPEDDEDRLRIVVFVCENDAYPAIDMSGMKKNGLSHMVRFVPVRDMSGMKKNGLSHMVRFVPVRCLGSVNMAWIRDALSAGMDGAMLLGCAYGDDYQCHFVKGSEIANKVAITDYDKIPQIINDFVEEIVEMGPNPFKGF